MAETTEKSGKSVRGRDSNIQINAKDIREKIYRRLRRVAEKQHYGFIGKYTAVKICTWTKKSIKDEGYCYKQKFYGIQSHLCCQFSPTVGFCQNRCIFCWRNIEDTIGTEMDEYDDVDMIIEQLPKMQKKLLSGLGGYEGTNMDKLKQAFTPRHFAISLTGETLTYPKINELIRKLNKIGSTFVVSNGLLWEKVKDLEPPTQLYISLDAPNEELFKKIDRSVFKDGWKRLMKTLDILREMRKKTRTVLRLTIIKGMNDVFPEQWAELIRRADPMFVEVKGYMFVGASRNRMSIENMPRHEEVKEFALKIADVLGYKLIDEKKESRVVLLMEKDFDGRIMNFDY